MVEGQCFIDVRSKIALVVLGNGLGNLPLVIPGGK